MARTRTRCSSATRCRASRTSRKRPSRKIDAEIRRLVEAGYAEAQHILDEKRADLETLAKGLLEFETLTGDEIKDLLAGKRPTRESVIEPATPRGSAVPPAGKPRPRPEHRAGSSRSRRRKSSSRCGTNARPPAGVFVIGVRERPLVPAQAGTQF